MVLTSIAKGRRFRVPRIAQRRPRVLLHNAETAPIASARADVARVPIMAAWPNGYNAPRSGLADAWHTEFQNDHRSLEGQSSMNGSTDVVFSPGRVYRRRDPVATPIVARMDELFAVDAEARRRVIGFTGRHALRQERAKPLLDEIRSKIDAAHSVALPSSALSKACQYALTLWRKLTRFLEYPELELSNNLAENSMRPVALGRKNWIHIGSPQAGPKVAAILSVVESCRRLQVSVRDYFSTILPGLADLPIRCLPDLTPAVWAAQHS